MVYCSSCGKNVADNVNFCPDCGGNLTSSPSSDNRMYTSQTRSAWWYLAPLLFGLIGGIIAYFIIKKDDPQKAKNCLIIGGIFFVIWIITASAGF